jgi:hypothetical protein
MLAHVMSSCNRQLMALETELLFSFSFGKKRQNCPFYFNETLTLHPNSKISNLA